MNDGQVKSGASKIVVYGFVTKVFHSTRHPRYEAIYCEMSDSLLWDCFAKLRKARNDKATIAGITFELFIT